MAIRLPFFCYSSNPSLSISFCSFDLSSHFDITLNLSSRSSSHVVFYLVLFFDDYSRAAEGRFRYKFHFTRCDCTLNMELLEMVTLNVDSLFHHDNITRDYHPENNATPSFTSYPRSNVSS